MSDMSEYRLELTDIERRTLAWWLRDTPHVPFISPVRLGQLKTARTDFVWWSEMAELADLLGSAFLEHMNQVARAGLHEDALQ